MSNVPPTPPPPGDRAQPRVTPGLIVSILSVSRLAEVAGNLSVSVPALAAADGPSKHDPVAQRMLAQLNDTELRALARSLDVPTDGHFIDLYRRLHRLC